MFGTKKRSACRRNRVIFMQTFSNSTPTIHDSSALREQQAIACGDMFPTSKSKIKTHTNCQSKGCLSPYSCCPPNHTSTYANWQPSNVGGIPPATIAFLPLSLRTSSTFIAGVGWAKYQRSRNPPPPHRKYAAEVPLTLTFKKVGGASGLFLSLLSQLIPFHTCNWSSVGRSSGHGCHRRLGRCDQNSGIDPRVCKLAIDHFNCTLATFVFRAMFLLR